MAKCMTCERVDGVETRATHAISYLKKGKPKVFWCCEKHQVQNVESAQKHPTVYQNLAHGEICPMCDGNGKVNRFRHVQAGICFRCSGKGHW